MSKRSIKGFALVVFYLLFGACIRESDIDQIPDDSLLELKTLADAQAILDNIDVMSQTPGFGEVSADDIYITDNNDYTPSPSELNAYLWNPEIYTIVRVNDWDSPYKQRINIAIR